MRTLLDTIQTRVPGKEFTSTSFMALSFAGLIPALYALVATVVVIILIRIVFGRAGQNLPPGPTGLPLFGSLHLLSGLAHQNLAELAKKYGPLMSIRLGQRQCIIATSPETAMEFLKKQDANWCARPPILEGSIIFYGQDIVFQSYSPIWRHMRKLFQMELTGQKRMGGTRHVREEEIARLIHAMPQYREVELRVQLEFVFTNIISRLVLNRRFSARLGETETEERKLEIQTFTDIVRDITTVGSVLYPGDFMPSLKWLDIQGLANRFTQINRRMDALVTKIIAEHQAQRKMGPITEQEKDMVHTLLDELGKSTDDGNLMTMTNVKAVIWDAFAAGTDTLNASTEWIMSEVVRHPDVQARAHAELDRVVGQHRLVQEADIANLDYIKAIVKEGMRLHPVAPVLVPHMSIEACKAFGYDIPAETHLFVNVWAIGRDERLWDTPLEFNPDRFVRGGPNAAIETQGQHFQLLPFGAGRRVCPAAALGNLTLQLCTASLLHAFQWSVAADPGRAEGVSGGIIRRALPLRVTATPRLRSQLYPSLRNGPLG